MPSPVDREKALETALAQIDRQFGKGSVMRLGSEDRAPVEVIPTGSIALDVALGVGGLPRGRIIEIYGPESSGKTTLTLHAIANAQRAGGIAAFVDAEHALDPDYAKKLGVDIDSLLVSQPDTGEQALEIADMLVRSGSIDLIVIDSVAALVPRAEIEGEMGDSHVGLQARLMSQALRKLTGGLNQTNTTMIFINQLREKIGVFFGSPETTAGGKALKFYASVRLDIRRIETLKDGTEAVGNRTRVKVVKNKMAPPFKQAEFDILYGVGISREGSLIDYGVDQGIVKKSGAWYTYDGDQLGQGKENARNFLLQNPDIAADIEKKILVKLGIGPVGRGAGRCRRTSSPSRASSGARAPERRMDEIGERSEMSDASEHLAPVSYLPWATPVEPAAGRSATPDRRRVRPAEVADPDDEPRTAGSHVARADPASGDPSERLASRRASRAPGSPSSPTIPTRRGPSATSASTGSWCRGSVAQRSRSPRCVRCSRSTASTKPRSRSGSSGTSASATSTMRASPSSSCTSTVHAAGAAAARSCRSSPAAASMPRRPAPPSTNSTPRSSAATPSPSPNGGRASSPGSTGRPPSAGSPRSSSGAATPATWCARR